MTYLKRSTVLTFSLLLSGSLLLSACDKLPFTKQAQEKLVQKAAGDLLTEEDLAGIKDPLIRKHLVAQAAKTAYRISTTSSGKGEGVMVTEIQLNGTTMTFHNYEDLNGKRFREMIIIGDTTYLKDEKDGSWWKQTLKTEEEPVDPEETTVTAPDLEDVKEQFLLKQTSSEFKKVGEEACGTLTCYKYQEITMANQEATRTFWFDTKEYLLRKES